MSKKIEQTLPWIVLITWLLFYLAYPYHDRIDDVYAQHILKNKAALLYGFFGRPIPSLILYLHGFIFGPKMDRVAFISIFLHLGMGLFTIKKIIPRLPANTRTITTLGVFAALLHPVAFQTVIHVSQRSEMYGTFFCVLAIYFYLVVKERPAGPIAKDFLSIAAVATGALLSKELFVTIPLCLLVLLSVERRSRVGAITIAGLIGLMAISYTQNSATLKPGTVHGKDSFQRSEAYRKSVEDEKVVSNEESILFPFRTGLQNIQIQAALIPTLLGLTFFPFGIASDYGHFPFGKDTYSLEQPQLWLGIFILLVIAAGTIFFRRRYSIFEWILIYSPALLYSVYFVISVNDPLFTYRLYGIAFFALAFTVPTLLRDAEFKFIDTETWPLTWQEMNRPAQFMAVFSAVIALAGLVRFYEMKDSVREALLDKRRVPLNYRAHLQFTHELVAKRQELREKTKVPCKELLEPVLKFVPTTSLVFISWAWCEANNGDPAMAAGLAKLALEQEMVPQDIQVAISYAKGKSESVEFKTDRIHPSNLKQMVKPSDLPSQYQ